MDDSSDRAGPLRTVTGAWSRATTTARVLLGAWAVLPAAGVVVALAVPSDGTPKDQVTVRGPRDAIVVVKRYRLGQDASAQQMAKALVPIVEACFTGTQDYTQCRTRDQLGRSALGTLPLGTEAGQVMVVAPANDMYNVTAISRTSGVFSIVRGPDGSLIRTCQPPGKDGCRADSRW